MSSLTGAVGVHHETLVDVVLDEQQRLLEDLSGPRLLHGVGVPRVPEESQQLPGGARLTAGRGGRGNNKYDRSQRQKQVKQKHRFSLWGFSVRARGLEHQAGISPVGEFKHAAASASLRSRVAAIISLFVVPASSQTSARCFSCTEPRAVETQRAGLPNLVT